MNEDSSLIESNFTFLEEEPFLKNISEEEHLLLEAFRYTSWTGKSFYPGQRSVLRVQESSRVSSFRPISEDISMLASRAYGILSREFEKTGRKVKYITFIQEKAPKKAHRMDIAHIGAAKWHNHDSGESSSQALLVLSERSGTEFVHGSVSRTSGLFNTLRGGIHKDVEDALASGNAKISTLKPGYAAFFNQKTIHKRSQFQDEEPRVVAIVEFEVEN